jgi:predicted SAM-dependent methyltransferase
MKIIETIKLRSKIKKLAKNGEKIKFNMGSGDIRPDGFINIDLYDKHSDIKIDILNLPIEDNTVDEILCSHVIEHIDYLDGKKMIMEYSRILKPGGKLIVETANLIPLLEEIISCSEEQRAVFYTCLFAFPWVPGMGHKFLYSEERLYNLLKENEFEKIEKVKVIEVDDYSEERVEKYKLYYDEYKGWMNNEIFQKVHMSFVSYKK